MEFLGFQHKVKALLARAQNASNLVFCLCLIILSPYFWRRCRRRLYTEGRQVQSRDVWTNRPAIEVIFPGILQTAAGYSGIPESSIAIRDICGDGSLKVPTQGDGHLQNL